MNDYYKYLQIYYKLIGPTTYDISPTNKQNGFLNIFYKNRKKNGRKPESLLEIISSHRGK